MKNTISLFGVRIPYLLLFIILSIPICLQAQTEDEESLEYLLDDGNADQMFILKTNLMGYADGNYSLAAEFRKNNKLGLEFAYGLQRSPLFRGLRTDFWDELTTYPNFPYSSPNPVVGGHTLYAGTRLYSPFGQAFPDDNSYGILHVKGNIFNMESGDTYSTIEYSFGGGFEYVSEAGFVFDLNFAAGFRQAIGWESSRLVTYNISLLLGYRIF